MSFEKIVEHLESNKKYTIIDYLSEKWVVTDEQLDIFLKRIIDEIHHGSIKVVSSTIGRGTTIQIKLDIQR